MILPPAPVLTFTQMDAIGLSITIHWKVYNGISFCFPESFDVINDDFILITSHIKVRSDKVYIDFIIFAIEPFHLNDVSMSLLPMVLFAFLGC